MTSAEKKQYLKKYGEAGEKLELLLEERERWKALSTKMTPSYLTDISGKTGSGDKLQKAVEEIEKTEQEISAEIDRIFYIRQKFVAEINRVSAETQRTILFRRYILGESFETIAAKIGYTLRHVTRLHGFALLAFQPGEDVLVCPLSAE